MSWELTREKMYQVVQAEKIENADCNELFSWFKEEKGIADFAPDGVCRTDPRDGSMVIYNASRAKRPHDNRTEENGAAPSKSCPICEGRTTGIVDVASLSSGYTFINKNLFPCVYPFPTSDDNNAKTPDNSSDEKVMGIHLLQWTSSQHDKDWHNMPIDDLVVVLGRLAALEYHLLIGSHSPMPNSKRWHGNEKNTQGFVSIIKNVGAKVGGSLSHGHQQIVYSNTMPTGTYNNWRFQAQHNETYSEYIQRENPKELEIADLGESVALIPYFMKRPYFAQLLLKDVSKQHLFDLTPEEMRSVAMGWQALIAAYHEMLPQLGREVAYNVLIHNGPGAGLYFEFLPFTQETGGYEQLGLWVCQSEPEESAVLLKKYFLNKIKMVSK